MIEQPFGLVLSGGGAKGAYEVGVVRALAEIGVEVSAISGASIGSLNGAILAAAPTLKVGVERLHELWHTLAEESLLRPRIPPYLVLLGSAGLSMAGGPLAARLATWLALPSVRATLARLPWELPFVRAFEQGNSSLLCSDPLHRLMDRYLDLDGLKQGVPLYVSVYRDQGAMAALAELAMAELGITENRGSEFLHLQSTSLEQQRALLLASAALPVLFRPEEVDGVLYTDGGQGGWQRAQGNTPISPLLDRGISRVIVVHLSDGSLWSRHDFPGATIVEVRPQSRLSRGRMDLLSFNHESIGSWIRQGYDDTMACWARIERPLRSVRDYRQSSQSVAIAEQNYEKVAADADRAMGRLKRR